MKNKSARITQNRMQSSLAARVLLNYYIDLGCIKAYDRSGRDRVKKSYLFTVSNAGHFGISAFLAFVFIDKTSMK